MDTNLKVKRIVDGLIEPSQANPGDAGYDLRSTIDCKLKRFGREYIPCGFAFEIPNGYVGLMFPRSSMAVKYGLVLANGVGVIDSSYRGQVVMVVDNLGRGPVFIRKGDAIAQLVVIPYATFPLIMVDELTPTERGLGGFGSTTPSEIVFVEQNRDHRMEGQLSTKCDCILGYYFTDNVTCFIWISESTNKKAAYTFKFCPKCGGKNP